MGKVVQQRVPGETSTRSVVNSVNRKGSVRATGEKEERNKYEKLLFLSNSPSSSSFRVLRSVRSVCARAPVCDTRS